jgi:hypothetical protein
MTERTGNRRGAATRRTLLGALGTAVAAGPLVRGARAANPTETLTLYLHVHEDCTGEDVTCASGAATDLFRQFNERFDDHALSWTFETGAEWPTDRDRLESDWERIAEDAADGHGIHVFLMREVWQSDNGYGHRIERVSGDGDGVVAANVGGARFWDGDRVAANLFVHEVLHAMNAFHADGEVTYVSDDDGEERFYTDISPMATAYVRYVGWECNNPFGETCADTVWPGTGTVPDTFSNGTANRGRVTGVGTHSPAVADAAWDSVGSGLDEI